jgi:predicted RNase H-like HicB family nuclease
VKYAVLYDQAADGSWGAVIPDLPGCTSAGDTLAHTRENVKEAIDLWIEVERERGHCIPPAATFTESVDLRRD